MLCDTVVLQIIRQGTCTNTGTLHDTFWLAAQTNKHFYLMSALFLKILIIERDDCMLSSDGFNFLSCANILWVEHRAHRYK
jgi:hypothetical protein